MTSYHCISAQKAEQMIEQDNVLVLDMRDFRSYLNGHHSQALHLNDANLRSLLKHTAKHIPLIIYCYHGHSSQDMAQLFADFGFENCYSVDGGYEGWFPAVKKPTCNLSSQLQAWMHDKGFNPDNVDQLGWNNETALMRAAREGDLVVCEELLAAGASINLKNKDGNNALWLACYNESSDVIELLISHGVDIDNQNDNGATALIYSASAGKTDVVRTLIRAGANPKLSTLDDFSALDVAANIQILRMLRPMFQAKGTERVA